MQKSILTTQKDHLGIITLNRPDVFNSITRDLALNFQNALDCFANDVKIRAIMITGNGKAFCAGQDLQEAVEDNGSSITRAVDEHYNPIVTRIRAIAKPVLAAVNGVAAGAGANLALACDVVVASESSSFIQAFSKIGLIPDSGGTFILPRLIGLQKASALMMLGDKVSASDAERMGMIYQVFGDDEFAEQAEALTLKLSNMPTKGLRYTKYLLNQSLTNDWDTQLEQEKFYQAKAADTYDCNEGIRAFLEKRKPKFKGE